MLPGGGPGGEVVTGQGPYRAGCRPWGRGSEVLGWGAGGALLPFVLAPRPDGAWMARGGIGGAPLAPAASSLVI